MTLICSWFAWSFYKSLSLPGKGGHQLHFLWVVFFLSIASASFMGGLVHGFFLDNSTWGHQLLWPATLLAIGVTATMAWLIAGMISSPASSQKGWRSFAAGVFGVFASMVLFYSQSFTLVVFSYLPAMLTLLAISIRKYILTKQICFRQLAVGLVVSLLAAVVQVAGLGIHSVYFDHNSTYHVVQALGLWFIFKGASRHLVPVSIIR